MKCSNCNSEIINVTEKVGKFCPYCNAELVQEKEIIDFLGRLFIDFIVGLILVIVSTLSFNINILSLVLMYSFFVITVDVIKYSYCGYKVNWRNRLATLIGSWFIFFLSFEIFRESSFEIGENLESFGNMLFGVAVLIFLLYECIVSISVPIKIMLERKLLLEKEFSDNDIMIINDFSFCKILGYYLLKMKFDNVIKFKTKSLDDSKYKMVLLEINEEYGNEKIKKYCRENSEARNIVDFIKNKKADSDGEIKVTLMDLIKKEDLILEKRINSTGGIYYNSLMEKFKNKAAKWVLFCFVFSFFIVFNSLYNSFFLRLILMELGMAAFCALVMSLFQSVIVSKLNKRIRKLLLTKDKLILVNYEERLEKAINNLAIEEDEKKEVLRTYTIYEHSFGISAVRTPLFVDKYSTALFGSIAAVEQEKHL